MDYLTQLDMFHLWDEISFRFFLLQLNLCDVSGGDLHRNLSGLYLRVFLTAEKSKLGYLFIDLM